MVRAPYVEIRLEIKPPRERGRLELSYQGTTVRWSVCVVVFRIIEPQFLRWSAATLTRLLEKRKIIGLPLRIKNFPGG